MIFTNVYNDARRAEAYDKLAFPGTYYLAYRDLPDIIKTHVAGRKALDFGCGAGRSTRFLKKIGFDAVGVDIAEDMLEKARERDPDGEYRLVPDGDLGGFPGSCCDLVLSVFTFDNIPTMEQKVLCCKEMGRLLKPEGRIVNLVSSPRIYTHEWASFTTRAFPENQFAQSGDKVRIVMTDVADQRPVEDILWKDEAYQETYRQAGLQVEHIHRPLAEEGELYEWVSETSISPWVIYVLKK